MHVVNIENNYSDNNVLMEDTIDVKFMEHIRDRIGDKDDNDLLDDGNQRFTNCSTLQLTRQHSETNATTKITLNS